MSESTNVSPRRAVIYCRVSEDKAHGRSVAEQEKECRADCERSGWPVGEVITDNSVGASRWSSGVRSGFERLADVLRSGDVLVYWEASRATRDLATFVLLREMCASRGVLLRYSGKTLDPASGADRFTLGLDALLSEKASEETRERVLRAHRASAAAGEIHGGRTAFGYMRVGVRQIEPDPETSVLVQGAATRVLAGASLRSIAADWRTKGVTRSDGGVWTGAAIGRMLVRPVYAGKRAHQGRITADGNWAPLWGIDQHRRLVALLSDPKRRTQRGIQVKYLLSGIATCAGCGGPVGYHENHRTPGQYRCRTGRSGCVSIRAEWVDDYVTGKVFELFQHIAADLFLFGDDTMPQAHQDKADELRGRLDEFTEAAARGDISVSILGKMERSLQPQIDDHERRAAGRDPLLAALVADPHGLWNGDGGVEGQRNIIRLAFRITLHSPGRGAREFKPECVDIRRIEQRAA
ncbi:recombinase family protein [Nocardia sp. NPDC055165]